MSALLSSQIFFPERLSHFQTFLGMEGLGSLNTTYCEVGYINHIQPNEVWATHADFGLIFPMFEGIKQSSKYLNTEESGFSIVYRMLDECKRSVGRLRVGCDPRFLLNPPQPIYHLELTARGYPLGEKDLNGIERFLDMAHREIVLSFTNVTFAKMHKLWGRNDVATD